MPGFPNINLSSLRRRSAHSCPGISSTASDNVVKEKKRSKLVDDTCCTVSSIENSSNVEGKFNGDASSTIPTPTACGDDFFVGQECLKDSFYDVPCEQLAKALLGKLLVRRLENGNILKGRIVETECYLGGDDKASHSFRGKMTERNAPMFMKPGTAYVYFTYGMYYCFNISSQGPGAAVLIRALEPIEGADVMAERRARGAKKKAEPKAKKALKPHELCNGPSKLCIAFDIDRDSCNRRDLATWPGLCVCRDDAPDAVNDAVEAPAGDHQGHGAAVVVTKRVGIDSAGSEWADKPLRFYLLGNPAVSKRDRAKEKDLVTSV